MTRTFKVNERTIDALFAEREQYACQKFKWSKSIGRNAFSARVCIVNDIWSSACINPNQWNHHERDNTKDDESVAIHYARHKMKPSCMYTARQMI